MKQSRLIRRYINYKDYIEQRRHSNIIPMYIFANASIKLYRDSR